MGEYSLSDLIVETSERNKQAKDIPVYSVTNSKGFIQDYFIKDVSSKDKTNYKIVRKDEFAFNPSRINVGSIDCLTVANEVIVSPLYTVFRCKPSVFPQYLRYFFQSHYAHASINSLTSGSVRATVKIGALKRIHIQLPSLACQKERVQFLNRIRDLKQESEAEVKSFDELIKSRFNGRRFNVC